MDISEQLIEREIATRMTPADKKIYANNSINSIFTPQTYYIPNRENNYMGNKGRYTNIDTELKKSLASKNKTDKGVKYRTNRSSEV